MLSKRSIQIDQDTKIIASHLSAYKFQLRDQLAEYQIKERAE